MTDVKTGFDSLMDHLIATGFFLEQAVEILEKGMIERAMKLTAANQSEASKLLGIHRNTLQRKMVQHNIDGKRPRRVAARKPVARATPFSGNATASAARRRSAS